VAVGLVMLVAVRLVAVMLAAVIGLQFGIAANRNSGVGVALLLLMTGLLGWWLGPILNFALAMKNGMQLVGYAAVGNLQYSPIDPVALLLRATTALRSGEQISISGEGSNSMLARSMRD